MIAGRLAVSVRQTSEPANLHPSRQIEPFHSARADLGFRNVATDNPPFDRCYRPRTVSHSSRPTAGRLEVLNHLAIIHVVRERERDDERIATEPVRVDRRATGNRREQFVSEHPSVFRGSLSSVPTKQQLRIAVNGREDVTISDNFRVMPKSFGRLPLHSDKRPLFVTFDHFDGSLLDRGRHELGTRFTGLHHQAKNRIAMKPGQTFAGSDGHSFQQHPQQFGRFFQSGLFPGIGMGFQK